MAHCRPICPGIAWTLCQSIHASRIVNIFEVRAAERPWSPAHKCACAWLEPGVQNRRTRVALAHEALLCRQVGDQLLNLAEQIAHDAAAVRSESDAGVHNRL